MAKFLLILTVALGLSLTGCDWIMGTRLGGGGGSGKIIDHADANVDGLTASSVIAAKTKLNIAYWHTSHGSQLISGMAGMDDFFGGTGLYAGLTIVDNGGYDLGSCDYGQITRDWLDAHPETNVVMWSWCGQVSGSTEEGIAEYLSRMSALETEYPNVRFVYMTGHSDGSGTEGNLHARDQQIRAYCVANGKFLFDFYDIECYDPDGVYYGDRHVTDACNYDADGSGDTTQTDGEPAAPTGGDRNWAADWQAAHSTAWWASDSAHSMPLNANRKAMAAWRLFVELAGSL